MMLRDHIFLVEKTQKTFIGVLESATDEANDLMARGYYVNVAWVANAVSVFSEVAQKPYHSAYGTRWAFMRWKMQSIGEHLRYLNGADLSWSTVLASPAAIVAKNDLRDAAARFLEVLQRQSDQDLEEQYRNELTLGPR